MKPSNSFRLLVMILIVIAMSFTFSSCKKQEEYETEYTYVISALDINSNPLADIDFILDNKHLAKTDATGTFSFKLRESLISFSNSDKFLQTFYRIAPRVSANYEYLIYSKMQIAVNTFSLIYYIDEINPDRPLQPELFVRFGGVVSTINAEPLEGVEILLGDKVKGVSDAYGGFDLGLYCLGTIFTFRYSTDTQELSHLLNDGFHPFPLIDKIEVISKTSDLYQGERVRIVLKDK